MDFDLARTPTLQAVATADERRLVEDLQQRVEAAARQAEELPEVVAAVEAHSRAEEHLAQLQRAERALNAIAKDAGEKLGSLRESALDGMIRCAGNGEKPDFKALSEVSALEARVRHATRAIERLVERLIPCSQLVRLREESHAAMTRARALEAIAQERAEKLLGQLRDAVSEEVVLPVDLSKGVAGALLAQASEYKRRALQLSENADGLEKTIRG